jgi:hypothetical protein
MPMTGSAGRKRIGAPALTVDDLETSYLPANFELAVGAGRNVSTPSGASARKRKQQSATRKSAIGTSGSQKKAKKNKVENASLVPVRQQPRRQSRASLQPGKLCI